MDEIDFESAKPIQLAAEVSPEKTVQFFSGDKETPLHPKEITESMLAKLYENLADLEQLSKLTTMMKNDIKELGRGLENVQKGKYIAMFKVVKGRRSVNWQRLTKALIGDLKDEDLEKYSEEGETTTRLEIRRLD